MRWFIQLRFRLLSVAIFTACAGWVTRGELAVGGDKPQPARVSRWGYDKTDATPCLQPAMGSGAKTLLVDNVGSDWVVGPIQVPSNLEIVFADGVVVRAKKGGFQKPSDSLFDAMVFRGTAIDNRKSNAEAVRISSGQTKNLTGLRIEDLTVIDDQQRPPIRFISRFSNGLVDPVVSGVKTRNSAGAETPFDCAAFVRQSAPLPAEKAFRTLPLNFETLRPISGRGRDAGANIRFRQKFEYLQWAKAGQKLVITFTNKPVHRFDLKAYRAPLEVAVRCPSRAVVGRFGIPFDGTVDHTLEAAETGVYRFEIDARMQTTTVKSDAPGQAFSAAEPLYVFGCSGRLYFHVPAGVKNIRIEAGGSPREASTVCLLDARGKRVDAGIKLEGSRILQSARADDSEAEVWSIQFTAAKLFLRIGAPLPPLFSTDAANLLLATAKATEGGERLPQASTARTRQYTVRPASRPTS